MGIEDPASMQARIAWHDTDLLIQLTKLINTGGSDGVSFSSAVS